MQTFFDSLKRYVGFGDADSAALRDLLPAAAPHFERISSHFYQVITEHPDAHEVLEGPKQIERLKKTLVAWMKSGLEGPHDEVFYERRARIGRVHVVIGLPQQFMFTAMNVMRLDFREVIEDSFADDTRQHINNAVDKLFDLELAIMLQTYREDSDDKLRRKERLATIGQIAASIGHDLRNPLGVIQSSMYLLRKRADGEHKVMRHLDRIDTQVSVCETIITNLLELARSKAPRREPIDFEQLFAEACESLQIPESVTIEKKVEPGLSLDADRPLLRQALTNLIANSVQVHAGKPGTVSLRAFARDDDVVIEVADDGPGFDPLTIATIFEPLVTTKKSGTGLGLALVKGVAERHGGMVRAENGAEGGAVVRMTLPRILQT